jgi:hypothetical protein
MLPFQAVKQDLKIPKGPFCAFYKAEIQSQQLISHGKTVKELDRSTIL